MMLTALLILLGASVALSPLVLIHLIARIPRNMQTLAEIQSGNPLCIATNAGAGEATFLPPLLQMTRTHEAKDLRATALGLRFTSLESAAPILKHCARSSDTELQLYAQTVMADGQEKLLHAFLHLRPLATPDAAAECASFISAGLRLLDSPLTPDSEHASIFRNIQLPADSVLAGDETHPRLVFEAARLFVRIRRLEDARTLHARLSTGSPLHENLARLINHHGGILAAQTPLTTDYEIR